MKIFITGAAGSIGQMLVKKLKTSGHEIFLFDNNIKEQEGLPCFKGDLSDESGLTLRLRGMDAIIHLAGVTHTNKQSLYYRVNVDGTKNLLKAAQINGIGRFIYISSRAAVENGGAYSHSKYLAEAAVRESGLNWLILQPAEVYGAGKGAIEQLVGIIKNCRFVPIIGNGKYLLSPVWVDDIVAAILASLNNNSLSRQTYVLAGPEELSYNRIVDIITDVLRVKRIRVHIPLVFIKFAAWLFFLMNKNYFVRDQIPRLLCKKSSDISLARQDLSFDPMPFAVGIKKLIEKQA
ncbi:MAG TPA: NAD-dependent epimerase/dehydratase family protein [Candidatus Portnoybacteria bacterium]|nr:NAD-dependent epimerase/dehydratase family protein [Candidatus Portnoybacteria bacterium]